MLYITDYIIIHIIADPEHYSAIKMMGIDMIT